MEKVITKNKIETRVTTQAVFLLPHHIAIKSVHNTDTA